MAAKPAATVNLMPDAEGFEVSFDGQYLGLVVESFTRIQGAQACVSRCRWVAQGYPEVFESPEAAARHLVSMRTGVMVTRAVLG